MVQFIEDNVLRVTATANWECGQMVLVPDGRVGVVLGLKPVVLGQEAAVQIRGILEITAGAGLTAGVVGAIHIVNQNLIATGGGGVNAGKVLYTVLSGAKAYLDLNV